MQKQCSKCSHDSVCKYKDEYAEMIDRAKALVPEGHTNYPVLVNVTCMDPLHGTLFSSKPHLYRCH